MGVIVLIGVMMQRPFDARVRAYTAAAAALTSILVLAAPSSGKADTVTPPVSIVPQALIGRTVPPLSETQRGQLIAMLDASASEGLTDANAPTVDWASRGDPEIVNAALDRARALHGGRLASSDFLPDWGLRPAAYDPWPSFSQALADNKLKRWIAALPPPYAGYDSLRKGLAAYREIEADGGWQVLAPGPDLTLGAQGPRVTALRKRLRVEDKDVSAKGDGYDLELVEAVRRAQRRYGLNPSGIVSGQTLAALNVPVRARIDQIVANLERWRWLPQQLEQNRVQVNIAAAVLTVFDGDKPVASMRAVTGRPGDETPMLESRIHSIVINPPWNVPTSIATKELWPKGMGYLQRNGFKVIALPDGGKRLQQAAGPKSALGRLKFDFDNPYSVYLHDTPSQSTFSRYSRLASHGCVRLEKPVELANLLLASDPVWASGAVEAAIAKGPTQRVRLQQPVAVYLFYWTAFASANGQMNFRADPYGWDGELANRITARARLAAR